MKRLRVAMLAPPWLPIPPRGYGGIENVIQCLVPELIKLGTEVELFAPGDSKVKASKLHSAYPAGQYGYILRPQYETGPILTGHLLQAINYIIKVGNFDVIHDHNNYVGPLAFAHASVDLPPVIHTLHNPSFVNSEAEADQPQTSLMWREVAKAKDLYLVSLSKAMLKSAPPSLRPLMLKPVYNAVSLEQYPFIAEKEDYFITLGRFHPVKGVHIAVEAAVETGHKLKMAGMVNDLGSRSQVMLELANPASRYRTYIDFRYFSDKIVSHLYAEGIEYVGEVSGRQKIDFISRAKGLLAPIQWEEPFGMGVIEALACGTPVIGMARGALPEIIKHGVNGFLVDNKRQLKTYMKRIEEIDPRACRSSVEKRFSARVMAKNYYNRYLEVVRRSQTG